MRKQNQRLTYQLFFTSLLLALSTHGVKAETTNCTAITSVPYTITVQGVYCLTGNLATSMLYGNAIEILTNNVTIDLNGYKIGGLGAGFATQTKGIYANQRKNITIRNGSVRGFYSGIFFDDASPFTTSTGHLIENIRADGNTAIGLWVEGLANTIKNNLVFNTAHSTIYPGAYGIAIVGKYGVVKDNIVNYTTGAGANTFGMYVSNSEGTLLQNNLITKTDTAGSVTNSYSVHISNSQNVTVRGNTLTTADIGLSFSASSGKYIDTITHNIGTAFSGGTAVGINN